MEERAREFYCGFMGLAEISKPESLTGRGGFWIEVRGFQIHVGTEEGVDRAATKAHLAWEVAGLGHWREKLAARDIRILEGIPVPGMERFEFRDPFGNRVEFLEKHTDL